VSNPPAIIAVEPAAQAKVDLVLRLFAEVLSGERDVAKVDELLSADYVDHDPAAADDNGRSGVGAKLQMMWQALPDGRFEPDIVVAAADLVSVRSRLVAGGAEVEFADVYRVGDDGIDEHWHVVDTAALIALMTGGGRD